MKLCAALDCDHEATLALCDTHWLALPLGLRQRLRETYQRGQVDQSQAYKDALSEALRLLAEKSGKQPRLPLEL